MAPDGDNDGSARETLPAGTSGIGVPAGRVDAGLGGNAAVAAGGKVCPNRGMGRAGASGPEIDPPGGSATMGGGDIPSLPAHVAVIPGWEWAAA